VSPLTEPFGWPKRETGRACRKRSFRAGRGQKQKSAPASWSVCGRGRPEVYQTRRRKELHAPKRRRNVRIIGCPAKLLACLIRIKPNEPDGQETWSFRVYCGRYQSAVKSSASKLPSLMQARAAGRQRLSALAALRGSKPAASPTADGLKASVLAGHPGCTPADGAAGMTDGGSCHAYPVNPCPTHAASKSDLRDHAVRLRNRRKCHSLRRCRNRQGEASNSNQPDHSAPPLAAQSPDLSPNGDGAALMFKRRPRTDFRR
jgi:hypothetical protein